MYVKVRRSPFAPMSPALARAEVQARRALVEHDLHLLKLELGKNGYLQRLMQAGLVRV